MFDIHIITCFKTYNRLPDLLDNIKPLFRRPEFGEMRLFVRGDVGDIDMLFSTEHWSPHIQEIYHILGHNISICSAAEHMRSSFLRELLARDDREVFPERQLRPSEMSLASKHYTSLKSVSRPTIVLEDDSLLPQQINTMVMLVEEYTNTHFINLACMKELPYSGKKCIADDGSEYLISRIGFTRTTAAYAIGPDIASKILSIYFPQALPIDLHLQYVLQKLKVPGISHESEFFINKSFEGLCTSSIQ